MIDINDEDDDNNNNSDNDSNNNNNNNNDTNNDDDDNDTNTKLALNSMVEILRDYEKSSCFEFSKCIIVTERGRKKYSHDQINS